MCFEEKIRKEPKKGIFSKDDLLKDDYLIASEKNLEVYFAPFDYINEKASVVIVGITPGWTQMEKAYRTVITEINNGCNYELALRKVKSECSFAGSMRTNLVAMLDELRLHEKLGITSTADLFNLGNKLLHSTSALRYPFFNSGRNYTGSAPSPLKSNLLWEQIEYCLVPEMNKFTDALIIPLGVNVSDIFVELLSVNKIKHNNILVGFPHPSGANGHRLKQFESNKIQLISKIEEWASTVKLTHLTQVQEAI